VLSFHTNTLTDLGGLKLFESFSASNRSSFISASGAAEAPSRFDELSILNQYASAFCHFLFCISRFGIRAQRLGTEEIVELYYKLFNPAESNRAAPKNA
jgi:hypothetical protein